jgi:hypothetical protein
MDEWTHGGAGRLPGEAPHRGNRKNLKRNSERLSPTLRGHKKPLTRPSDLTRFPSHDHRRRRRRRRRRERRTMAAHAATATGGEGKEVEGRTSLHSNLTLAVKGREQSSPILVQQSFAIELIPLCQAHHSLFVMEKGKGVAGLSFVAHWRQHEN